VRELIEAGHRLVEQRTWDRGVREVRRGGCCWRTVPLDLEALGVAAVWSDHHDASIDARMRAHAAYVNEGDPQAAARVAIAPNHIMRTNTSAAEGWFGKASRRIEDEPESVHGELAAMTALIHLAKGEAKEVLASAETARRIGREHAAPDLVALGQVCQGYALARLGRVDGSP
jgi:hypothetical protein